MQKSGGGSTIYTAVKIVYTAVYRLKPFELAVRIGFGLKFEFARYLAVYRGIYRYRRVPVFSQRSVKTTLISSRISHSFSDY
jgi:hypothetical protein